MHRATRILCLSVILALAWISSASALPIPEPPNFSATSFILVDHDSGQVLAAKNAEKRIEPASITKIMTSYIVFDELDKGKLALDDKVTISEHAWRMGGSKMFVEVDKQVSVEKLLHGMITSSGNDATVALAEHLAGSEATFAQYMNQYASDLGLENSHFTNATGWPHKDHYMSAHDIARLSSHMIEDFPDLYERFFHQKEYTYNEIKQYNRNSLLWTDDSVDGLKTGHTESAGYCLAVSAEREGMRLVSVVTGTGSNNARSSASQSLLSYGFRFFETYKVFDAGHQITDVTVWKGAADSVPLVADGPVYATAPRDNRAGLSTSAELPGRIMAPVEKGQRMGTLKVAYQGEVVQEKPLYAAEAVPEAGIFGRLMDEFWLMFE